MVVRGKDLLRPVQGASQARDECATFGSLVGPLSASRWYLRFPGNVVSKLAASLRHIGRRWDPAVESAFFCQNIEQEHGGARSDCGNGFGETPVQVAENVDRLIEKVACKWPRSPNC